MKTIARTVRPIHPGECRRGFLPDYNMTASAFAVLVCRVRPSMLLNERRTAIPVGPESRLSAHAAVLAERPGGY
jgi:hypothetical protein